MMKKIDITCPYCGHVNQKNTDTEWHRPKVVLCDVEDGGCDNYFAARVRFDPVIQTHAIDGEGIEPDLMQPAPLDEQIESMGDTTETRDELIDNAQIFLRQSVESLRHQLDIQRATIERIDNSVGELAERFTEHVEGEAYLHKADNGYSLSQLSHLVERIDNSVADLDRRFKVHANDVDTAHRL